MPIISDELKVFGVSVILLILDAPRRVFRMFVMDYLPAVETSSQCLCYHKTVFFDITHLAQHWEEEVIFAKPYANVSSIENYAAAFPNSVFVSFAGTRFATATNNLSLYLSNPRFTTAIRASVPDEIAPALLAYFGSPTYVTKLWARSCRHLLLLSAYYRAPSCVTCSPPLMPAS